MDFEIINPELKEIDSRVFKANKIYNMAMTSLDKIPNVYAAKEFVELADGLVASLKEIKTEDEFETILIKNHLYNLESQKAYLEYFTIGGKDDLDSLFKNILGDKAFDLIRDTAKNFSYKKYWDYFLSYQEFVYKQLPSDDETLREEFKKILESLKADVLEYASVHFNLPNDYEFDLVLGQPYSNRTFFHPTTRRMEISPGEFFVFKEGGEVKINVCMVIKALFHELIGHGRHEFNSRNLPDTLKDNSINTAIVPLHIHAEGVSQISERESIKFMEEYSEKYKIEKEYIEQVELSWITNEAHSLYIFYQYLKLKNLEDKNFDIESEFKKWIDNHGLFVLYSSINDVPLGCLRNATYPVGLDGLSSLLEEIKNEMGEEKFKENHSLINEAVSVGLFNFRVLPDFIRLFLRKKGL